MRWRYTLHSQLKLSQTVSSEDRRFRNIEKLAAWINHHTPLVGLGGKGAYGLKSTNSPIPGSTTVAPTYSTTNQTGLALKYKSPYPWLRYLPQHRKKLNSFLAPNGLAAFQNTNDGAADKLSQSKSIDTLRFI